jgi:hypothetical protein
MPISEAVLSTCQFRLGRLSAALDRSPLRRLWLAHETAVLVSELYSRGASPISADALMALGAGVPGRRLDVADRAAQRFWSQALRLWGGRVTREPASFVPEITKEVEALVKEGMPAGDLALEAPLRLAQQTGWPLPCAARSLPSGEAGPDWRTSFVDRLADEAGKSERRLMTLERDFSRWQGALPAMRADSRLGDALVLLGTFHALTPRYVAETLGLTRQAAARLLRRLEEIGVIRRAVERQRWIIYLAENISGPAAVPDRTNPAPPPEIDTDAIDRVLDDAYRALSKATRSNP